MSQAEELLNSMTEEVPVHEHPVPDTDTYFIIDPITRKIENTNRKKNVVMQYDHNSERFTFELPRYVDGHDMLECTSITVNVDNIEVIESDGVEEVEPRVNSDAPDMTDLRVHPNDPEKVISSWLISRNSTQLAGVLSFHIEYKCVDANGNVVYEWSTDTYDEIEVRARKKNGEAAVIEHTDLLEQWRTRIFGAGDSVMADITAEGEAQVAAVKAESETQQEAVELKGAQTLDSIPEDYTEVDAMAEEAVRSKGDAIVCESAGEPIVLKDSSNDHIRGLKLFGKSKQFSTTGKNLVDMKDFEFDDSNYTHWVSTDSISASSLYEILKSNPGKSIVLSATIVGTPSGIDIGSIRFYDENNDLICGLVPGVEHVILDSVPDTFKTAYIYGSATGASVKNLQIEYGRAVTSYEPYTGGKPSPNPEYPQEIMSVENPTVRICGKNLLNNVRYTTTQDGVTFTVSEDKTVMLNGTAEQDIYFYLTDDTMLEPGTYRLSGSPEGSSTSTYYMYVYPDYHSDQHGEGFTFEVKETTVYSARIYVKKDTVCNNVVFKPQIERGSKTTTYEPYAGWSIDITHTLPGIPVTSGGNYTDSDGQQWICDEVDLERGAYVRRISSIELTGKETWSLNTQANNEGVRAYHIMTVDKLYHGRGCCTHFANAGAWTDGLASKYNVFWVANESVVVFKTDGVQSLDEFKAMISNAYDAGNPVTLYCARKAPIETPLTAEEIAAFKALRTNYPNSTILNDAGAWMSVKYNADTKTYVENPKTLKLVDSSTGVVYELKIVDGNLTVNPVT